MRGRMARARGAGGGGGVRRPRRAPAASSPARWRQNACLVLGSVAHRVATL